MTINLSFTDYTDVETQVYDELPGCPDEIISKNACAVFAEFCRETLAFKEEIDIPIEIGETRYELTSPYEDCLVLGLAQLDIDNTAMLPGQYLANGPGYFDLTYEPEQDQTATAIIILSPKLGTNNAPQSVLERWMDCICTGVKARLMVQPGREWTQPELGMFYKQQYGVLTRQAAADVRSEFSSARRGRNGGFTASVYGNWSV